MPDALLEASLVSVAYGKVRAVQEVSLRVAPGTVVSVIGANGAGKTTLLCALMGLLPCTGGVRYAGEDVRELTTERRVARGLSLVAERRELFGSMSVHDNLLLGAFHRRRDPATHADLEAVFERFPRLRERHRQQASTLSGGERQMLALGRALMARPRLLMLDEPSLGLAPLIVHEIFRIVRELKDNGVSILLVEQNARAALQIADYGYVLETGAMALEGPARELEHDPRVVETYLGLGGKEDRERRTRGHGGVDRAGS
ncbi:MAG: ABC transporter ATP-binding protein [Burkholderiales bacterium]|nr:ABC transporter ATP-binding protein [Burkholderiales bacterium]